MGSGAEKTQVHLDEKYFRRIERFDGDPNHYRGWIFELVVALGQVDGELQQEVEKLVLGNEDVVGKVPMGMWEPKGVVKPYIYSMYRTELYGLLVSLTGGEAKGILKGMLDTRMPADGFKALVILRRRFEKVVF